jgi:hypothetical protein
MRERMESVQAWEEALLAQPAAPEVPDPDPMTEAEALSRAALLGVPVADRAELLATLPDKGSEPRRWEALLRCHQVLFAPARVSLWELAWPEAPAELGPAGRWFYVHLYLYALPTALARHAALGIPSDVSAATFGDVGSKVVTYRLAFGMGGLDRQTWLVRHFRASLYRLGRLQFDRAVLDVAGYGAAADGGGPQQGTPVLEVHIPGDGPLTDEACEASVRQARPFFAKHFPGERYEHATCRSWLLDPQLADHLPAETNILRFQRRFRPFGPTPDCDDDVLEFVFHRPKGTADLDRLPQDTTLQRAVVAHLRAGHHWRAGCGWLAL